MTCLLCHGCCILLKLTKDFFSPQLCIGSPSYCMWGMQYLNGLSTLISFSIFYSIQIKNLSVQPQTKKVQNNLGMIEVYDVSSFIKPFLKCCYKLAVSD